MYRPTGTAAVLPGSVLLTAHYVTDPQVLQLFSLGVLCQQSLPGPAAGGAGLHDAQGSHCRLLRRAHSGTHCSKLYRFPSSSHSPCVMCTHLFFDCIFYHFVRLVSARTEQRTFLAVRCLVPYIKESHFSGLARLVGRQILDSFLGGQHLHSLY